MEATWLRNDRFSVTLPQYPTAVSHNLIGTFASTRPEARGNLLGYLSGTANYNVDEIKEKLRKRHRFSSFRPKEARNIRDEALRDKTFNFMHCAYRYRGKAHYRDAIYICYGSQNLSHHDEFLEALTTSSRFSFLCALAFVGVRIGNETPKKFIVDLSTNLRGVTSASPEELFWRDLPV